jgi:hypothetical protein
MNQGRAVRIRNCKELFGSFRQTGNAALFQCRGTINARKFRRLRQNRVHNIPMPPKKLGFRAARFNAGAWKYKCDPRGRDRSFTIV